MKGKKVQLVAKIINNLGLNDLGNFLNLFLYGKKFIRAVNYHSTPENFMSQFETQMMYYSKNYSSVSKNDLKDLLIGNWKKDKPGLIISFDDGLESNYKYAKPILEKYDFQGWFFIPVNLIGTGFCKADHRTGMESEKYMTASQVKDLHASHVIGCHTLTHKRLNKDLSKNIYFKEICESKKILSDLINEKVEIFCWVGGEIESYSKEASALIKTCGYKYSFLTNHSPIRKNSDPLALERTNIEADWPIYLIKFYTSFFMDMKYKKKRNIIRHQIGFRFF